MFNNTRTRLVSVLLSGLSWCSWGAALLGAAEPDEAPTSTYISPAAVKVWLEEGKTVTFLDVRQADEFEAGHLINAINIHYDHVASLADQLPHDQPIVLYCIHSAHRAPAAAKTLQGLGFSNTYVLEGGIVAWQAGGLSIRANDLAKPPTILPKTERCEQLGASQDATETIQ